MSCRGPRGWGRDDAFGYGPGSGVVGCCGRRGVPAVRHGATRDFGPGLRHRATERRGERRTADLARVTRTGGPSRGRGAQTPVAGRPVGVRWHGTAAVDGARVGSGGCTV